MKNKSYSEYYMKEIKARLRYVFISFFLTFYVLRKYNTVALYAICKPIHKSFIFVDGTEFFYSSIFIHLINTSIIVFPYIYYQWYCYWAPVVPRRVMHKRALKVFFYYLGYIVICNVCYQLFANIFQFFIKNQVDTIVFRVVSEIRIKSFTQNYLWLHILSGILLFVGLRITLIPRRWAWRFLIIMSSFMAPPEYLSQTFLTGLFLFLYEFGILCRLVRDHIRKKKG